MKKLIVSIAAITMLTGLAGCKTVNDNKGVVKAKTEQKETESSKLAKQIANKPIQKANPNIGDTPDQVKNSSWGESTDIANGGNYEIWYYPGGKFIFFEKGKVTEINENIQPKIGMSKEEVINTSWGKPESINKTTNAYGTNEQWVYSDNRYLYFENGILTDIQE
ncbi:hypothetical protein [Bacillus sp. AFS017336]|uniref:hypothetical protein n=1 Tax=Bacillus sp. AFS017336 TaxID=2033489 RepID=UPI000BF1283E|nr:hypothetical protein [Bacillus sp. AFS017336]PEL13797.1 hypothetical protein CN601_03540 [Bacillus sp. AFS017336]